MFCDLSDATEIGEKSVANHSALRILYLKTGHLIVGIERRHRNMYLRIIVTVATATHPATIEWPDAKVFNGWIRNSTFSIQAPALLFTHASVLWMSNISVSLLTKTVGISSHRVTAA